MLKNRTILVTLLFLITTSVVLGQDYTQNVVKGSTHIYKVTDNSSLNHTYLWEVFTSIDCSSNSLITNSDVEIDDNTSFKISVKWNKAGTYYLRIRETHVICSEFKIAKVIVNENNFTFSWAVLNKEICTINDEGEHSKFYLDVNIDNKPSVGDDNIYPIYIFCSIDNEENVIENINDADAPTINIGGDMKKPTFKITKDNVIPYSLEFNGYIDNTENNKKYFLTRIIGKYNTEYKVDLTKKETIVNIYKSPEKPVIVFDN